MNEEKKSLQNEVESLVKNEFPFKGEHPLNMLDKQADPNTKPKSVIQKPIRTYESDLAEELAKKRATVITMAIAENKKETGTEKISNTPVEKKSYAKNTILFILSMILVVVGIGGGYYLYLQSPLSLQEVQTIKSKLPSIISPDIQKIVPLGTAKGVELPEKTRDVLINGDIQPQKITEFVLMQGIGSSTQRITGPEFIKIFDLKTPDIINRSITDKWMLGTFDTEKEKLPFIILTSDFFQNTYAGMLKWENSLPDELAVLLNYESKSKQDNSATTTLNSFFTIKGKFEDRTIMNRDVREFINESGEMLVLYSFVDKDTLIITTSEITLKSLIEKIEKQTYIR